MKRIFLSCMLLAAMTMHAEDYTLRVLTFEDADYAGEANMTGEKSWSSLIDDPQYQGSLLYGPSGYGFSSADDAYKWSDDNNTWLSSAATEAYGAWCFWNGCHAISNYGTANYSAYNDYTKPLTVYNPTGDDTLTQKGNGYDGSDNFAIHYGYADNSGYSLGVESLPTLSFSDGTARVIDHMWVTSTTYFYYTCAVGSAYTAAIKEGDWVKIVATGFNGDTETGSVEFYLCNGPDKIIKEWTKFDLSELGEVTKVRFNMTGNVDNGYGFSQPAYFAYDNVAVRFPINAIPQIINSDNEECVYYDLFGRRVINPGKGIYICNGKKVLIK